MAYVQVPPDGAGKKIYSKTHTVGANTVEGQINHLADSNNPSNLLSIDARGSASVRFAEGQPILSGFGGLKTVQARTLGVYESSLDTYDALFSTIIANGGASTYNPVQSSQILSVTGDSASRSMLITNRYHYYQPASSNLFTMTVSCGDSGKANNARRWGGFDENDGVFFELDGTQLNVVIRSSTTGSVVNTKVPKSSWNGDKLDGTGLSNYSIDVTKINVYWMDYQWLGAGRVRFGIYSPEGSRIVCHSFENAGQNALPYMRTGTLPVALENVNYGVVGSASELRSVCAAVYTEGTFEDYAFWRFADVDATLSSVTTEVPAFSFRSVLEINSKHNSVVIYPETLNVYTTQPVAVTIWQNTVVTGGTWSALASAAEVNYSGSADTSEAQRFKTLYFDSGTNCLDLDKFFEKNDEGVMAAANSTAEIWTFTIKSLSGSAANASINLGYKELW